MTFFVCSIFSRIPWEKIAPIFLIGGESHFCGIGGIVENKKIMSQSTILQLIIYKNIYYLYAYFLLTSCFSLVLATLASAPIHRFLHFPFQTLTYLLVPSKFYLKTALNA